MSVLITPVSGNKAQIILKNFGKYHIRIITCDHEFFSPGFFSKYSHKHYITPSPITSPRDYIAVLIRIIQKENIDVLLPVHSTETLLISQYKEELENYCHVPFSDYNTMLLLHDKAKLYELASKHKLPVPATYSVRKHDDLNDLKEDLHYPVVLKPRTESGSKGVKYAYSKEQLEQYFDSYFNGNSGNLPLIQEYIDGCGYGVSAIFNHGKLITHITHKRLREYPLTGGPSTLRISTEHKEMESIAINLLTSVNWHGVAMVEFKLDNKTGKPFIIEVNPRFWGSINQAISSGIDFPYLLYQMGLQGEIPPVIDYKKGVKTMFLTNDLRVICNQFLKSKDYHLFYNWIQEIKNIDAIDEDILGDPLFYIIFSIKELKQMIIT